MPALILDKEALLRVCPLEKDIESYPEGIIIPVDKPYRWTSADVVRKLKWAACTHFGKRNLKVGHAGTLDPLATGVLLLCIGKATKLAEDLQRSPKEYIAGLSFGATTPSYDLEKEIDRTFSTEGVSEGALRSALVTFLGEQEQVAPLFSAKSIDGVRAYEMARTQYKKSLSEGRAFSHEGEELLSRQRITISGIELLSYSPQGIPASQNPAIGAGEETNEKNLRIKVQDISSLSLPHARIRVACSKGTYIRALARDIGEAVGSGAFLDSLQRSASGSFRVEKALSVDEAMWALGR